MRNLDRLYVGKLITLFLGFFSPQYELGPLRSGIGFKLLAETPPYDFAIVGGGTAGLTIANRLTENLAGK